MASNFIYSAPNAQAEVTVLTVNARVSAARKAKNWFGFLVKTLDLERKPGSTW